MKPNNNYILILNLVVALLASAFMARAENPADFTVDSAVDGSQFQLSKQRGKVVVLHFLLKTECPFCLKHTHDYAALAATTPEVVHVFLKPDSVAEIKAWAGKLSKNDLKELPRIYRDSDAKLATQYGIPDGYEFHGQTVHFPALVVLDGKGKELFRDIGKNNSDRMKPKDFTVKLAELTTKP